MARTWAVEPIDPAEIGIPAEVSSLSDPDETHPISSDVDLCPCFLDVLEPERHLPKTVSLIERFAAQFNDWLPTETAEAGRGYTFWLNYNNVKSVNAQCQHPDNVDLFTMFGALNWADIRSSGFVWNYTNGTPTAWLHAHPTVTACQGVIGQKGPMNVWVCSQEKVWANWIHRARIIGLHEIQGHGTQEYGRRLYANNPNSGGHVADRFSAMSYQPYPNINPFLPTQFPLPGGGYGCQWGKTPGEQAYLISRFGARRV